MEIATTRMFTITLTEAEACRLIDALADALRHMPDEEATDTPNVTMLADLHDAINNHVFC